MVDVHELDTFKLRSYGISNDGTVYVGTGSTSNSKLVVSGINTSKFYVGEKVKVFGVTATSDNVTVPGLPSVPSFTKVGTSLQFQHIVIGLHNTISEMVKLEFLLKSIQLLVLE